MYKSFNPMLLLISLLLVNCDQKHSYVPPFNGSISQEKYSQYANEFYAALERKDFFEAAFYLGNIKADYDDIYHFLVKSVEADLANCERIYEVVYLAEEEEYYRHIYRMDTMRFYSVFRLCEQKLGSGTYAAYLNKEKTEEKEYLEQRSEIDSSLLDRELMEVLLQIDVADQLFRKKATGLFVTASQRRTYMTQQARLDSLNLIKVDSLLSHHGYPELEEVGHDLFSTIGYVIHHQSDPAVRRDMLARIQKYIDPGLSDLIESRTLLIEDELIKE